ncbi:diguanylate cyclase [Sedimentibacter sp. zth1]|uniref:sensor domain-containing diguanylate cyclase n=1 Tax=Sedimentibacter sp. zth1 TaxID=2816908 RepID=UPI001A937042|nr:sensor domain-containing diguanylate cyclase [Sedimentibacter sp. zth1]QSX05216.1 diguanylate cyclase [Sedimentibacter sp. zth1]
MYDFTEYDKELELLLINENNIEKIKEILLNYKSDDLVGCRKIIDHSIEFCKKNNLNNQIAWFYYCLGWNYLDFQNIQEALNVFYEAKEMFEKYDNLEGMAYAYNGLSSMYSQLGQYDVSSEVRIRGIVLAVQGNYADILNKLLINFSIELISNNEYSKAKEIIEYIDAEYKYSQKNILNQFFYKNTLAQIEINIGNANLALKYLFELNDIINVKEAQRYKCELNQSFGMAYFKLKDYKKAEQYFKLSYDQALSNSSYFEACNILVEWLKLNKTLNDNKSYIKNIMLILSYAKDNKLYIFLKMSYKKLYDYYKEIGDYKKSLYYLEMYDEIESILNTPSYNKLLAKLNIVFSDKQMSLDKLMKDKTELISDIGQKIISVLDIDKIYIILNDNIDKIINRDYFNIAVYNSVDNEILYLRLENNKIEYIRYKNTNDNNSLTEYCLNHRKTILINDLKKEYKVYTKNINIDIDELGLTKPLSIIYVPLLVDNIAIGVMTVQSMKKNAYANHDVNILKVIGNYAAIAFKNAIEYKSIQEEAVYDSLTGFLTKREILKEGQILIDRFKKLKESFCVFMVDIDNFSNINNTFGHVSGDNIIKKISKTINSIIRSTDLIGRYGGDEFLLFCPGLKKEKGIILAERLKSEIYSTEFKTLSNELVQVSVSIGVYEYSEDNIKIMEAINNADISLYREKESLKIR